MVYYHLEVVYVFGCEFKHQNILAVYLYMYVHFVLWSTQFPFIGASTMEWVYGLNQRHTLADCSSKLSLSHSFQAYTVYLFQVPLKTCWNGQTHTYIHLLTYLLEEMLFEWTLMDCWLFMFKQKLLLFL